MSLQTQIKELADTVLVLANTAQIATDYLDLALQAENIASLSRYQARIIAIENGCDHSRFSETSSSWGSIKCDLCGKYGYYNSETKKAEW